MKTWFVVSFLILICVSLSAQESEIMLETREGKLYGTLSVPEGKDSYPLVIIVGGSRTTDRDGNSIRMKNNTLKYLADALRENGVASLRYDKRGIGESTESLIAEKDIRLETYVNDASEWVNAMNIDARFSKIFVAGHSEGSLVAILCARTNPFVKGLICLSATSQPLGTVLRRQLKDYPDYLKRECFDVISKLEKGRTVNNISPFLYNSFKPSEQPYLISWMKYDPVEEVSKLNIPILVIQGNMDIQLIMRDAELLASSNVRATKKIIKNMNHVLKDINTKDISQQEAVYLNPDLPIKQELISCTVDFIFSARQ